MAWPGLRVEYAWLPPFEGEAVTKPNRLEVVFSAHGRVALGHDGHRHVVAVEAGAGYVVGDAPTILRRVTEYSDTLEIYPDPELMRRDAEQAGVRGFELEPTLRAGRAAVFRRDPVLLGVAHRLRRAALGRAALSDIEAGGLAHLLTRRVLARQYRLRPCGRRGSMPVRSGGSRRRSRRGWRRPSRWATSPRLRA